MKTPANSNKKLSLLFEDIKNWRKETIDNNHGWKNIQSLLSSNHVPTIAFI